jgi:hypothetical protein
MKDVARMIRNHLEGIVAWTRTRMTNGFLEALNGLFQAAKRKPRDYRRPSTIRTIIPARRETRLPNTQPACRLTHSEFKRAFFRMRYKGLS